MFNIARSDTTSTVEVDSNELSETGRVVVTDSLGVTEGFQDRVGLDDLIFKSNSLFSSVSSRLFAGKLISLFLLTSTNGGEVGNDLFGVFGLTGSRFTSNQHGLIFVILKHVTVGFVRDGEKMGWHLSTTLTHVHSSDRVGVDGKSLVGVDDDTEETRVGLNQAEVNYDISISISHVKYILIRIRKTNL